MRVNRDIAPFPFAGLLCLVVALVGALLLSKGFTRHWEPDVTLKGTWQSISCSFPMGHPGTFLPIYASQANWTAMLILELVVGAIGVLYAVGTLIAAGKDLWLDIQGHLLLLFGLLVIAYDAYLSVAMRDPHTAQAFLSDLLASLPADCAHIRENVSLSRIAGESSGLVIGIAISATVAFAQQPDAAKLAARLARLQRLLYVASILFVAGVLMARANFTLILSRWNVQDAKTAGLISDVIKAGVIQSGIGYSALLAVFYLPARAVLSRFVEHAVRAEVPADAPARDAWLTQRGLSRSWQEDARQILALVAPVLSAPILDALIKAG